MDTEEKCPYRCCKLVLCGDRPSKILQAAVLLWTVPTMPAAKTPGANMFVWQLIQHATLHNLCCNLKNVKNPKTVSKVQLVSRLA